jgi:hypothetical protein
VFRCLVDACEGFAGVLAFPVGLRESAHGGALERSFPGRRRVGEWMATGRRSAHGLGGAGWANHGRYRGCGCRRRRCCACRSQCREPGKVAARRNRPYLLSSHGQTVRRSTTMPGGASSQLFLWLRVARSAGQGQDVNNPGSLDQVFHGGFWTDCPFGRSAHGIIFKQTNALPCRRNPVVSNRLFFPILDFCWFLISLNPPLSLSLEYACFY